MIKDRTSKEKILGLDISTSCTGWCILSNCGDLVEMGYIDLTKSKTQFDKAQKVVDALADINMRHSIAVVAVEENLQSFRRGMSSAKTLLTLARFNGIVSYIAQMIFHHEPYFMNVNVARRLVGLKIAKSTEKGTKEQVHDWVSALNSGYKWPTKVLKSGPRKGLTVFVKGCYDMSDAYIIALSYNKLNTADL